MKKLIRVVLFLVCAGTFVSCEHLVMAPDPEVDARTTFDLLWKDFDRYYALFGVKKLDWNALYALYRPRVTAHTTQAELWTIITSMLEHCNDPHVYMMDAGHTREFVSGLLEDRLMVDFDPRSLRQQYLNGKVHQAGEGHILYGRIPNHSIGYIAISTFQGADNDWSKDIDRVVEELSDVNAMIIDIRGNPGGSTENYQYIASAFIDRKIDYLRWRARNGPDHSDFEPPVLLSVEPRAGKKQFTKPIALLTNRFSGSSSDHLAWMFKHYLPYSTQIGDTTVGDYGTVPDWRMLPNGWIYRFSARLVTSLDGVAPDSLGGSAPDILIHNSPTDIAEGTDRVMEAAIDFFSR